MAKKPPQAPPAPKAKPAKGPKLTGPVAGALSKYQRFVPERLHRSVLKKAAYNPRRIDDYAAAQLRKVLEKYGLVEALVWNKRTGNMVGGHQRLTAIDFLDAHDGGSGDFLLDICVIDVPLKREKALNIVLNNPHIAGEYDLALLRDQIGPGGELTADDVFFDPIVVEDLYMGTEWEADFRTPEPEPVANDADALRAMAAARKAEGKDVSDASAPIAADEDAPFGRLANGEAIRDPDAHANIKAEREHTREKIAAINDAHDSEYYAIVVLGSREEREALMAGLGLAPNDKYVNGRALMSRLGLSLESPTEEPTP
jgi:hypothetical protein